MLFFPCGVYILTQFGGIIKSICTHISDKLSGTVLCISAHAAVDRRDDFFLFIGIYAEAFQCLSCSAVGADGSFTVSMPRLSNACLVPQSGQMGVSPSVLDIAGRSVYSCPQMGHTLTLSSFVSIKSYASFPLFFSVFSCQIQSPCSPECRLPGSRVSASRPLVLLS